MCSACGCDLSRSVQPWDELHVRTNDAIDITHLRPGADKVGVDIGAGRRVALNRIARATGVCLAEQVRRALDAWLSTPRVDVEREE